MFNACSYGGNGAWLLGNFFVPDVRSAQTIGVKSETFLADASDETRKNFAVSQFEANEPMPMRSEFLDRGAIPLCGRAGFCMSLLRWQRFRDSGLQERSLQVRRGRLYKDRRFDFIKIGNRFAVNKQCKRKRMNTEKRENRSIEFHRTSTAYA